MTRGVIITMGINARVVLDCPVVEVDETRKQGFSTLCRCVLYRESRPSALGLDHGAVHNHGAASSLGMGDTTGRATVPILASTVSKTTDASTKCSGY